jgi:hypothetical protein
MLGVKFLELLYFIMKIYYNEKKCHGNNFYKYKKWVLNKYLFERMVNL